MRARARAHAAIEVGSRRKRNFFFYSLLLAVAGGAGVLARVSAEGKPRVRSRVHDRGCVAAILRRARRARHAALFHRIERHVCTWVRLVIFRFPTVPASPLKILRRQLRIYHLITALGDKLELVRRLPGARRLKLFTIQSAHSLDNAIPDRISFSLLHVRARTLQRNYRNLQRPKRLPVLTLTRFCAACSYEQTKSSSDRLGP